jgi:hypothetical protein
MVGAPNDPAGSGAARGGTRATWKRAGVFVIKMAVATLVLWAVGRHVARIWTDLHSQGRSLRVEPAWIAAAMGLYVLGLCAFGVFFWCTLGSSRTPVGLGPALRAYLISHLGKYVPGKAMVVVMRSALVVPYGARLATAAFASLYETIVMMAAGGLVAAIGFALEPVAPLRLKLWSDGLVALGPQWLALLLGAGFLALAAPAVFPRLLGWVSLPFPGVGPEALPRFSPGLLATGLAWSGAGWLCWGLSQVAVVRALDPAGVAPGRWPLVVASVALATVAGFVVAVLPGGLGVRELVIMTTLAPAVGEETAVVSALLLRLAWVLAEVLAAGVVWIYRPAGNAFRPREP